ncbi:MAG: phosphatidylserine decarboxylase [candidate division KSB1 bacterium]|nr:phosphatidylserine decarboxylase [candidate division KSB1 bacterium]
MSREGIPTVLGLLGFAAFLAFLGWKYGNVLMLVIAGLFAGAGLFSIYFFRDPLRMPPNDPLAIVSPCDGTVIEIEKVEEPEYMQAKAERISIFMSVFNVHVNYVPYRGVVEFMRYVHGRYYRADLPQASKHNVHILTGVLTPYGKMVFKQSTGAIARRLVNHLKIGDQVQTGQKFGIIKFGSRMEVYLPACAKVNVKIGDKVTAGVSVIARIDEKEK